MTSSAERSQRETGQFQSRQARRSAGSTEGWQEQRKQNFHVLLVGALVTQESREPVTLITQEEMNPESTVVKIFRYE
jgi:hypothetical protein